MRIGFFAGTIAFGCSLAVVGTDAFVRAQQISVEIRRNAASALDFAENDVLRALATADPEIARGAVAAVSTGRYFRRVEFVVAATQGLAGQELPASVSIRMAKAENVGRQREPSAVMRAFQRRFLDDDASLSRIFAAPENPDRIAHFRIFFDSSAVASDLLKKAFYEMLAGFLAAVLVGIAAASAVWRHVSVPLQEIGARIASVRFDKDTRPNFVEGFNPESLIGKFARDLNTFVRRLERQHDNIDRRAIRDLATGALLKPVAIDHLRRMLAAARRTRHSVAVLVVEIDRAAGRGRGKEQDGGAWIPTGLLRSVADRLRAAVRDGDVTGRLDDVSFMIAAEHLASPQEVADLVARIHEAMAMAAQPGNADRMAFAVGSPPPKLSVGVALAPTDGDDAHALLALARAAADVAAASGGDQTRFHSRSYDDRTRRRRAMERALAADIANGRLEAFAQPIVRTSDGTIDGVELLARWKFAFENGERREVAPGEFISLAEDCGLIAALGDFMLRKAADLCARLADLGTKVSLNVSAREFVGGDLPLSERIVAAFRNAGADPRLLELEVSETVFLENIELLRHEVLLLREAGIGVLIDDFGTGAAHIGFLNGGNYSGVKIDANFVASIPGDTRLASVIVHLANVFGVAVVAEGVETADQASWLTAHGVQRLQGFHFFPPMPIPDFEHLLRTDRRRVR